MKFPKGGIRKRLGWLMILAVLGLIGFIGYAILPSGLFGPRGVWSKVSRVRADHRALAIAIESYYADHNAYPLMRPLSDFARKPEMLDRIGGGGLMSIEPGNINRPLEGLTTPVAYITALPADPFATEPGLPFAYYCDERGWILISAGPDEDYDIQHPENVYTSSIPQPDALLLAEFSFDPTNGIESSGDIWRVKQ